MMRSLPLPRFESPAVRTAVSFVAASSLVSLLGKIAVTRFFFDYPIVILLLQHTLTLLGVETARITSVSKLPPYSFEKGRRLLLPSLLLAVSSWLTLCSFEGIAMPAFDAVKRFTPALTLLFAGVLARKGGKGERPQVAATLLVSFFSSLSVNMLVSLDRFSIFYGSLAAAFQAIAYLNIEQSARDMSPLDMVYLHSFNSLVTFLVADIVQDEIRDAFMFLMTSATPAFCLVFLLLLGAGALYTLSLFHALSHHGALATAVISNVRASAELLFASSFSIYMFYDLTFNAFNWVGLIGCIAAGWLFHRQSARDQTVNWAQKA